MLRFDQMENLKRHFRITDQSPQDLSFQSVKELLDPHVCLTFLKQVSKKFQTHSLVVTASQFAKCYSFMLVPPTLYAMSVYHKGLSIEPNNCYIQSMDEGGYWLPRLALVDWNIDQPIEERARWREQQLKQLFAGNLAKVWDVLHRCTGIHPMILWENTVVYVRWFYTEFLPQFEEQKDAQDDYQFLIQQATPELFGVSYQPMKKFFSKDGVRKTCCLYFLTTKEKSLCKGCPRQQHHKPQSLVMT